MSELTNTERTKTALELLKSIEEIMEIKPDDERNWLDCAYIEFRDALEAETKDA